MYANANKQMHGIIDRCEEVIAGTGSWGREGRGGIPCTGEVWDLYECAGDPSVVTEKTAEHLEVDLESLAIEVKEVIS